MWRDEPKRDDCPVCGKKEGATMVSSRWGHDFTCCSDSCGIELRERLEKNTRKPEYHHALVEFEEAREKVRQLKYQGLNVDEAPFGHITGEI